MYRDKVFISPPLPNEFQIEVENSEWLFLQGHKGSKLGGKVLSPETRNELVKATNLYASSLGNVEHTESRKVIKKKMLDWINATEALREEIWKQQEEDDLEWLELANRIARRQMGFKSVQETFLSSNRTDLEKQFPLALLSRILNGSTLTAVSVHRDLQHQWAAQQRNLWFVWAAMVFSILRNAGIPVRHPKRKKLLKGPLGLLERLQQKLPSELQLRGSRNAAVEPLTSESFRKGAVIAFKLCGDNPTAALEKILTRWVRGQFDSTYPKGSPEIDILLRLHRFAWPDKWKAARRTKQLCFASSRSAQAILFPLGSSRRLTRRTITRTDDD